MMISCMHCHNISAIDHTLIICDCKSNNNNDNKNNSNYIKKIKIKGIKREREG